MCVYFFPFLWITLLIVFSLCLVTSHITVLETLMGFSNIPTNVELFPTFGYCEIGFPLLFYQNPMCVYFFPFMGITLLISILNLPGDFSHYCTQNINGIFQYSHKCGIISHAWVLLEHVKLDSH